MKSKRRHTRGFIAGRIRRWAGHRAFGTIGCRLVAILISAAGLSFAGACIPLPDSVNKDVVPAGQSLDDLFDQYTDSHLDPDSDMQLLIDGPESLDAFVGLIDSAEHHIHVETLNFDDDSDQPRDTALEFARLFAEKARQGIDVRMIVDPIAQQWFSRPDIESELRESDIDLREYEAPSRCIAGSLLYRTHKKILIADGRRAIIGGMNYGYRYFGEGQWRDTNALLTGPVVATVQAEFLRDWETLGPAPEDTPQLFPEPVLTGTLSIRAMDQRPAEGDFDINNAILIALRSAEDHVDIEAPYFNPTDWLADELIAAADRGVEVRILVNSRSSIDIPITYPVVQAWFEIMVDHGVRVLLWNRPETMHSKAMVIDDQLAMVGSYNFNARSILWDTENAVFVTDPAAIEPVRAMIAADLSDETVTEVDDAWLAAHASDRQAGWAFWQTFAWLF